MLSLCNALQMSDKLNKVIDSNAYLQLFQPDALVCSMRVHRHQYAALTQRQHHELALHLHKQGSSDYEDMFLHNHLT